VDKDQFYATNRSVGGVKYFILKLLFERNEIYPYSLVQVSYCRGDEFTHACTPCTVYNTVDEIVHVYDDDSTYL